ncbi:Bidirectional sugar transporter SWEET7b [Phytophthora citrophthora]|uniref:Bidirectional sugar transporter SWEET7b n=1 Tax=Phytophthora citrophthora TaxID=4793 RepID=A0AAD9LP17_9STRA|nr:Bidirectional sugar transporter SWEET7b [Phytophthora citrophthora]
MLKTLRTMSNEITTLIFRILAGIATIGLVSSPAPLMIRIYKQKHVGVASAFPLAALLGSSHVWVIYGYLSSNYFPLVSCFLYGECCAIVFLAIYYFYSTDKSYVFRVLTAVVTIISIITLYAIVGTLGYTGQSPSIIETIMGLLADCGGFCLYGAPMEKVFQVLKHKSAVFINVHMVIAGLASNIFWLTYGTLIMNPFIMCLNGFFLIVNVFTLVLCLVYNPKKHPMKDWQDNGVEVSVCIERIDTSTPKASFTRLPSPIQPPVMHDSVHLQHLAP